MRAKGGGGGGGGAFDDLACKHLLFATSAAKEFSTMSGLLSVSY